MQHQRRLDRILADDYLAGLDDHDPARLRVMREECQAEEASLSYARRVLHGRLDLARAELQRRSSGGTGGLQELLAQLIDDRPIDGGQRVVHVSVDGPDDIVHGGHRSFDIGEEPILSRLPESSDDELHAAIDRWLELERQVSLARSAVHRCLDAVQTALVEAYRSGAAHVDDLLGGRGA